MDMNHFKLQFITHFTDTYSYLDSARMALEGGCRWVQLRMKHASDEETEAVAVEVQKLCRTYGATFLIDDRVELVRKLKADGLLTTYLQEESGGPPRKYYALTKLGRETYQTDRAEYLKFAQTVQTLLKEEEEADDKK